MIVAAIKIFQTESLLALFLCVNLGHILFLWMTRPFKRKRDIYLDYGLEFFSIFYISKYFYPKSDIVFLLSLTKPSYWTHSISMALVSIIFALWIILAFMMITEGLKVLFVYVYQKIKKPKQKVSPEIDIKPIDNILNHITRITSLPLDDRRQDNYEESKIEITLDDVSRFKKRGRTFMY